MATVDVHQPVAELVIDHPQLAAVLDELGIDYCCGGQRTLEEACRVAGVDLEQVRHRLQAALNEPRPDEPDLRQLPPDQLCDHIVERHHEYLRRTLPRLEELFRKVLEAHGERHPELKELASVFQELRAELEQHMMKEEMVLFPAVRQLVASTGPTAFPFGSVRNPIAVMEDEHDHAAHALRRLRELSGNYEPPQDACPSFRELYRTLAELEADLHRHIHKENNVLFPAVVALENRR